MAARNVLEKPRESMAANAARAMPLPSGPTRDEPDRFGVAVLEGQRRGRGAGLNPEGRFEAERREIVDDGWQSLDEAAPVRTEVREERARSAITRNTSPDIGFDRSLNAYRGCEHGCIYCYARPYHSYVGLSPGLDFETKLYAKSNVAEVLERELAAPGYVARTLALGTATDPYQPIERERRLTRAVLEVMERTGHPVAITTKSALVTRDIDILSRLAARGLAKVALSVTTLDRRLARSMEPRASTPEKRLDAIRQLTEAGVPTAVMVAPVIPALNDSEIERILDAAKAAGADEAGYVLLRLPLEVSELFKDWLVREYPDRFRHVMSIVRAMRDGKDYDASFGKRMTGEGPYAWTLGRRFELACKRLGLNARRMRLRGDLFEPPVPQGAQLSLF
ncbi:DNA repair photolyase [Pseudoxanthobacter soli DSM 19599]|uniref:DNA repair photolyase n=1 Tax=Pseudoxanthobacter soli DSM 19599 TaxID=1123029 RepID=A0A1M7Z588_9HYPH|nr:DNA repair photolyase [Pseudoxanthobacter soli DSM 19599]